MQMPGRFYFRCILDATEKEVSLELLHFFLLVLISSIKLNKDKKQRYCNSLGTHLFHCIKDAMKTETSQLLQYLCLSFFTAPLFLPGYMVIDLVMAI